MITDQSPNFLPLTSMTPFFWRCLGSVSGFLSLSSQTLFGQAQKHHEFNSIYMLMIRKSRGLFPCLNGEIKNGETGFFHHKTFN